MHVLGRAACEARDEAVAGGVRAEHLPPLSKRFYATLSEVEPDHAIVVKPGAPQHTRLGGV